MNKSLKMLVCGRAARAAQRAIFVAADTTRLQARPVASGARWGSSVGGWRGGNGAVMNVQSCPRCSQCGISQCVCFKRIRRHASAASELKRSGEVQLILGPMFAGKLVGLILCSFAHCWTHCMLRKAVHSPRVKMSYFAQTHQ